jgi:hypothetical protein
MVSRRFRKDQHQITIWATITPATPATIAAQRRRQHRVHRLEQRVRPPPQAPVHIPPETPQLPEGIFARLLTGK